MNKAVFIILTFFLFITRDVIAQPASRPLFSFLQKNADSTLVLEYGRNRLGPVSLEILSKKGDTVTAYTYKDHSTIKKSLNHMPAAIRDAFFRYNRFKILFSPVEVNEYFNPVYFLPDSLQLMWTETLSLHPWTINDDIIDGFACPPNESGRGTKQYDGESIILTLITKQGIKRLSFYAPEIYEQYCPGRKGRIAILKLEALFKGYFRP